MFRFLRIKATRADDLIASRLYDQNTFYKAVLRDLHQANAEVIIECPFMTMRRVKSLLPVLQKLTDRGVAVIINTREPSEHEAPYKTQAEWSVAALQAIGAKVLYTGGHHRKLVVIDRTIIWEGSLNVLSQNDSCEIMRRIDSGALATELIRFIGIEKYLPR